MIVKDIEGKEYEWKPRGKSYLFNPKVSGPHEAAREVLKKRFPTQSILEEVAIRVTRGKTLYFDFYIPMLRKAVEVHGSQHFAFSSKFHKTKRDLFNQQKNDRMKSEWCELNGVDLTILRFDEQESWTEQI